MPTSINLTADSRKRRLAGMATDKRKHTTWLVSFTLEMEVSAKNEKDAEDKAAKEVEACLGYSVAATIADVDVEEKA